MHGEILVSHENPVIMVFHYIAIKEIAIDILYLCCKLYIECCIFMVNASSVGLTNLHKFYLLVR